MSSARIQTAISVALLLWSLSGARAQNFCPEGRTFSGQCVKPGLAQSMRKSTILNTQPKISYTAPPLLPMEEYDYYRPPDFQEIFRLFAIGQNTRRTR